MTNAQRLNKQFDANMKKLLAQENVERHLESMVVMQAMKFTHCQAYAERAPLDAACTKLEEQRKRIAATCKLLGIDPGFTN